MVSGARRVEDSARQGGKAANRAGKASIVARSEEVNASTLIDLLVCSQHCVYIVSNC